MYRLIVIILVVIISSCVTLPNDYSFDMALENGIQKVENDLPENSDIAIIDFKSDNANLSAYIIEEIYDKLINGHKLSVMERSRTDAISKEVGYQFSGEVDDNEIINIGHQLGADFVVTGQIVFSGQSYRLRIFAIDIERGRRVASSSLNIKTNDQQVAYFFGGSQSGSTMSNISESQESGSTVNSSGSEDAIERACTDLIGNLSNNNIIAVINASSRDSDTATLVIHKLESLLLNSGKEIVMGSDTTMDMIRREHNFQSSDDIVINSAVSIGNMLGANIIITVSISERGKMHRLIMNAIDVQRGMIKATVSTQF